MAFRHATLITALTLTLVSLATPIAGTAAAATAAVPAAKAGQPAAKPGQPVTVDDIQDLINQHLLDFPGGIQTGLFQITYSNPVFVMDWLPIDLGIEGAGINGVPDCPSGWFCFYDQTNYGYPRGKLSACGWQDLARWGWTNRVESAHYNLSTGSVVFINHSGSAHEFDVAVFGVGTSQTTIANTSPYLNTADHVQRFC